MGALFDMKAFFRWLEEATDKELSERHEKLLLFIERATTERAREDAGFLVTAVEEEILARTLR